MKMRPIEMAVAYDGGHWDSCVWIEIPDDTPENRVDKVSVAEVLRQEALSAKVMGKPNEVVHAWLYNSMEDDRPENS